MAGIPLLSRLHWREYLSLVLGLTLVLLEAFIRVITIALPSPVINFFYNRSKQLFHHYVQKPKARTIAKEILHARGFVEICALFGYEAEEHVAQTQDGYLLGLHRIALKKGEDGARAASGKPVIYLHHGLMMNSEIWVVNCEPQRNIPFVLAEKGYDVWLGNNRGNKYSKKAVHCHSNQSRFWNFSMDEFALRDIPDSIEYILQTTKQTHLSYIGFSQGTAQSFATLSIHPKLNEKVDCFIALAPALSPKGLQSSIVDALMKASPTLIFLLFGRKAILGSTTFWQSVLYPPVFVRIIDASLTFLFGWKSENITFSQKVAAYAHLYSFTSVKAVVHWFQIMRNKCFQMYDDDVQNPLALSPSSYYKVAKFPTRNIKTPIVLIYGGIDSLLDIDDMLKELPKHTIARRVENHEHLDIIWGADVEELVFPHVFEALQQFSKPTTGEKLALDLPSGRGGNLMQAWSDGAKSGSSSISLNEDSNAAFTSAIKTGETFADAVKQTSNSLSAEPHPAMLRRKSDSSARSADYEVKASSRGIKIPASKAIVSESTQHASPTEWGSTDSNQKVKVIREV